MLSWQPVDGSPVLQVLSGNPSLQHHAVNGQSAVVFDGIDDAMGRSQLHGLPVQGADRSLVLVVKYDSPGWGGFTWGTTDCMGAFGLGVTASVGNLFVESFCTGDIVEQSHGLWALFLASYYYWLQL